MFSSTNAKNACFDRYIKTKKKTLSFASAIHSRITFYSEKRESHLARLNSYVYIEHQVDADQFAPIQSDKEIPMLLASFCLVRHWVCALVVIPWSSCNGDCGCSAQSASGRSSCRSGTQRLCRPNVTCAI